MSENKFENQVQHLMDELKFTPSEEVWPAIKNRIRQKRRRRFFFFLIPVMAGLLFTGYYFLVKTNSSPVSQHTAGAASEPKPASIEHNNKMPTANTEAEKFNPGKRNENGNSFDNHIEHSETPAVNEFSKFPQVGDQMDAVKQAPVVNSKIYDKQVNGVVARNETVPEAEISLINEWMFHQEIPASLILRNNIAGNISDSITHIPDNKLKEKITDSVALFLDSTRVVLIDKNHRSDWVWGIHVAGGASRAGNNTLPGLSPVAMDFGASPGTGGSLFTAPAKSAESGKAFTAGFILKRKFTPRSTITTGLQYFYGSDRLMAGSRYDSTIRVENRSAGNVNFSNTVNNYYRGNDQWYKNHYHFIELPLQYQYLLNKHSKTPVQLQAGLIFSQLLATNGLVYDRTLAGIYYEDKKQFNKSMLSITSGINVQLNNKQKLKWSVGPHVRAGITSMRKVNLDQNKYLFSAGLHVNLFFD